MPSTRRGVRSTDRAVKRKWRRAFLETASAGGVDAFNQAFDSALEELGYDELAELVAEREVEVLQQQQQNQQATDIPGTRKRSRWLGRGNAPGGRDAETLPVVGTPERSR